MTRISCGLYVQKSTAVGNRQACGPTRDHWETASRDRESITITRNGAGKVVLLAIEEYEAMETTLHLHSTRANASQIQQSLADYAAGKIQDGEPCD
jgi:antitoxin YefM